MSLALSASREAKEMYYAMKYSKTAQKPRWMFQMYGSAETVRKENIIYNV
jgi:hypothetical protein